MKMADGGYRPAYNVGFAADTKSQVIVGLDVTPAGNDQGQLTPMVRQLQGRYGRAPDALLADAGYLKTAEIDELAAAACGTTLYLPPRIPADPTRDPYRPLPDDSPTALGASRHRDPHDTGFVGACSTLLSARSIPKTATPQYVYVLMTLGT